jgi:hypothetical protein
MEFLRWLFVEDPRTLLILLGLVEIVLLVAWTRGRSRRTLASLAAVLLAAAAVWMLDVLVETDREKVRRSLDALASAAVAGQAERFIERISPAYASGPFRKDDLAALVLEGLAQVRVGTSSPTIEMEEGAAKVTQAYRFSSRPGARFQIPPEYQHVVWEGRFAPDEDGQWRLRQAQMVQPYRFQPEKFLPLVRRRTR